MFSAYIHGDSLALPFVDYFHTYYTQYQKNQVTVIKKGIPSVGTEAQFTYTDKRNTDKQTIVDITLELVSIM